MKKNISWITIIDIVVYALIICFVAYGKYQSTISREAFFRVIREDGWVEYLTALFLLLGSIIFAIKAVRAKKEKNRKRIFFNALASFVFFFGLGEEISWGQRIFSVQSGEYFMQNNYQGETNLHNLEIGGVDLNILIFSQLMFVALITYFILLPILTWKVKAIRKLVIDYGVPIPRLHHIIVLFAVNAFIPLAINMIKESELHELALTGIMFLILLNPAKKIKNISLIG
ncbi:hypothetical protein SLH46_04385 [Draconibacterium sp. IB214405]|uniref:hypothetical protein n=1 Tax=Draconibacterium sp. IB214405 TaxID=3097352 RepID=UPI002A0B9538|nr:hypothetical protein [Draconibacterium sp. IB214405]MDX8338410.1 hypothetical protein [Draconibacterium sp. IB214405]